MAPNLRRRRRRQQAALTGISVPAAGLLAAFLASTSSAASAAAAAAVEQNDRAAATPPPVHEEEATRNLRASAAEERARSRRRRKTPRAEAEAAPVRRQEEEGSAITSRTTRRTRTRGGRGGGITELFHPPDKAGSDGGGVNARPAQLSDAIRTDQQDEGEDESEYDLLQLTPTQRIVGGTTVPPYRYPWFATAFTDTVQWAGCAASLIAPDWVLTAAHCFLGDTTPTFYEIGFLGFECMKSFSNCNQIFDDVPIADIVLHPDFDAEVKQYYPDLALVKLTQPVTGIDPVAIDTGNLIGHDGSDDGGLLKWQTFTTVGTGFTKAQDSTSLPDYLQEVNVPFVPMDTCARSWLEDPNDLPGHFASSICAGGGGKDSCNGDSGGPLLLRAGTWLDNYRYQLEEDTLVGAVSFGNTVCNGSPPGAYASVGLQIDWIRSVVCDGENDPYFCSDFRDRKQTQAQMCNVEERSEFKFKRRWRSCGWLGSKSARAVGRMCRKRKFRRICPETCERRCIF